MPRMTPYERNEARRLDLEEKLGRAVEAFKPEKIRAAVEAGADVNKPLDTHFRLRPLQLAASFNKKARNPKAVIATAKMLLALGADPNAKAGSHGHGATALQLAVEQGGVKAGDTLDTLLRRAMKNPARTREALEKELGLASRPAAATAGVDPEVQRILDEAPVREIHGMSAGTRGKVIKDARHMPIG